MRKKSHISLAMYLVGQMRLEGLMKHKKAFYLGSILPDLTPKMITSPHEFDTSYGDTQDFIRSICTDYAQEEWKERILWRRIGVAMHYIADYFTFPHNTCFGGNLKDHCMYESEMKYYLRAFVQTDDAKKIFIQAQEEARKIDSLEALFEHIEQTHREYMQKEHSVKSDCRQIVLLCATALAVLVEAVCDERQVRMVPRYRCA